MIALLFPRFDHPAIEERYASWQSQMLLQRDGDLELAFYDPEEPASVAAGLVDSEHALVVTDPLLIPPARLATRLQHVLARTPDAIAAVPVTNEAENRAQIHPPSRVYLTLRELQQITAEMQAGPDDARTLTWDKSDPAVYFCSTAYLDTIDDPPHRALEGRTVVVSANDFIHRWRSLRGELREDLLQRISPEARNILEFGCGEARLGAALKARQKCRVAGIELDPRAAAVARKRIDDVYCGDARTIVGVLKDRFDWIIGGDIVEHIDEPWSFLSDLRQVCTPGGHLLLSIPNIAHGSVVADLLRGRFDYVYMGLTCVGHLRFFTRRSIEEMMTIAGWTIVEITPQDTPPTRGRDELLEALARLPGDVSRDDLLTTGYYVVAENR